MRHQTRARFLTLLLAAGVLVALLPSPGFAQIGIGPRVSWLHTDALNPDLASDRLWGVAFRAALSTHTGVEVSFDYRSEVDRFNNWKVRSMPLQTSFMLYPVRSVFAMYFMGGIGWVFRRAQPIGDNSSLSLSETRFGYHAGLGGELMLGRHAGIYLDYRYTFVEFNSDEDRASGGMPIPGTGWLQEKLRLSHEGSAWTTGVNIYF